MLTGWSVARQKEATDTAFRFRREAHEPGTKVVMGQTVVEGEKGGERLLLFLARHPSTAQFIAKKVATHFVADDPPASLVRRLAKSFEHSGGDLSSLALTLIESPETWAPNREKLKPPKEWILGIARGMGGVLPAERVLRALARLGQSPYTAPSPKGWPDRSEDWMGPEAVLSRLDVAERLGLQMGKSGRVGEAAVSHWLGPRVHISTLNALADTLSPAQQWALLFMSPEFQRR